MLHRVAHDFQKLQHPVARLFGVFATFRSVADWKTWPDRARVAKTQAKKSDADLAEAVTDSTGRKAGRAQVNHWFTGKREPTLSQFMSLCTELGADPGRILFDVPVLTGAAGPKVSKALDTDPREKASYGMQEKRLTMRRTPAKAKKKRRTAIA